MAWNQITIDVPDEIKDAILGELSADDVAGVWESGEPQPGLTRLVVYSSSPSVLPAILARLEPVFARNQRPFPAVESGDVADRDWLEEWKKSYTSFPIGSDFFVIPSWSKNSCPQGRRPIRIDPGQAFGTGTHETTQLTLEAMERWSPAGLRVLDLGCGSGILAIAAQLLGASSVIACDVDPVAVSVALSNFSRNAIHGIVTYCGSVDAAASNSVERVCCNITADLIVDLLPEISRVLCPGGVVIFSGILLEQQELVRNALDRAHLKIAEETARGEWCAIVAQRHGA